MFKRYKYVEGPVALTGSNNDAFISNEGKLIDRFFSPIVPVVDSEGHYVVDVHGWDGKRQYRVVDLMVVEFKNLFIEEKHYNRIEGFCIDGDKGNLHASNIGYRFKDGPIETEKYPGYYHIPSYTHYAIDLAGTIINVKTGKQLKYWITQPNVKKNIKGGYFVTNCSLNGAGFNASRHRSLCLAFKPYPDNVDSLVVNHIDGVPGHDTLDNLEWATRSANNLHAYMNGLKDQQMAVLVRDVRTGEVTEYYSICECARALGLATDESIRVRLYKSKFGQVFQDGTQVKLKSDQRDWIVPEDAEKSLKDARQKIPMKVRDCLTGVITLYDSVTDAANASGIDRPALEYHLKANGATPYYGKQYMYVDEEGSFPPFTEADYRRSLNPKSGGYAVLGRNLLSGEEREYISASEAVLDHGLATISSRLLQGDQPVYENGWQFKYKGEDWVEIKDVDEYLYKLIETVSVRSVKNGSIVVFENSAHAAGELGLHKQSVRRHALRRGNSVHHGYQFRLGVSSEPWPDHGTANNS